MNILIASGNIGGDCEVRYTPNGKAVADFSLPVKQGYGDYEKTSWVSCKLLGNRAEKLAPYLKKGLRVTVAGEFVMEEWEKDGVKHSKACVIVNEVELPPKSGQSSQNAQVSGGNAQQAGGNAQLDDFDDSSIPF